MDFGAMLSTGMEATGLFKSILDLAKGIKDLGSDTGAERGEIIERTAETMWEKVSELQQKHLELQQIAFALSQENAALVDQKRRFEEELARLQKFDAERELFKPVFLALNTFAFVEKTLEGRDEEKPLLCPNCFNSAEKCYLSFKEHAPRTNVMECSSCGTNVHVPRPETGGFGSVRVKRTMRGWNDLDDI